MDDGFKCAKKLCEELDIEPTPQGTRKTKRIYADGFADAGLSYTQEQTRQMITSLDKTTQEISTRFQQLHELDNQFCFLVPAKLLDPEYDCSLDSVPVDVSKEEFQLERQRLQNFIAGS